MLNGRARFILLFFVFFEVFLITTQYTDADLSAERIVSQNKLVSIVINLFSQNTASNIPLTNLFRTTSLRPGGFDLGSIRIQNDGRSTIKYAFKTVKVNGDEVFCRGLKLRALHRDFSTKFDGSLLDFTFSSTVVDKTPEDLIFVISLDDNAAQFKNKLCEFNFVVRSYRNSPNETGGGFAERKINNIVSSGSW